MNILKKHSDSLAFITWFYLAIPNLIFVLGWFKLVVALILCGLFVVAFINISIKFSLKDLLTKNVISLFILAIVCAIITGSGEFGNQIVDYNKHNIVFKDLIVNDWIVEYYHQDTHTFYFFCYYIGFYLPTALLAKATALQYASMYELLWTSLGIFIIFSWALRIQKQVKVMYILPFIFLGNLYIFFKLFGFEYYSFNYFLNGFSWLPQTSIPLIISLVVIYDQIIHECTLSKDILLLLSFTLIWSPFTILSIGILVVYLIIKNGIMNFISFNNIVVGGILSITVFIYYVSHVRSDIPIGLIFKFVPYNQVGKYYVLYYLNILLWVIPVFFHVKTYFKSRIEANIFIIVTILSFCFPLLYFGQQNDFFMKSSIFYALMGINIYNFYKKSSKPLKIYWLFLFIISILSPLRDIFYTFQPNNPVETLTIKETFEAKRDIFYTETLYGNFGFVKQSLGDTNSIYYHHLARIPENHFKKR